MLVLRLAVLAELALAQTGALHAGLEALAVLLEAVALLAVAPFGVSAVRSLRLSLEPLQRALEQDLGFERAGIAFPRGADCLFPVGVPRDVVSVHSVTVLAADAGGESVAV